MGIFNEFFKKEKPVFTGSRFGFGSGGGGAAEPASISGGTTTPAGITPGNGYRYHVFMSSGSFVVPSVKGPTVCDFMLIGGGGSGGWDVGGGGGAGGLVYGPTYTISSGTHPITVGAGGADAAGGPPNAFRGGPNLSGSNSVFVVGGVTITAQGGGGGGGWSNPDPHNVKPGANGGNGGGGAGYLSNVSGGSGQQPSQNPGVSGISQYGGYSGGNTPGPAPDQGGGGGGGTNGAGAAGRPINGNGAGGNAKALPAFAAPHIAPEIPAPTRTAWSNTVDPNGYYGFGGYGNRDTDPNPGQPDGRAAINGTGNGGAGGGITPNASDPGADGIVIIRYQV